MGLVWACWGCLQDLCSKRPQIPLDALVNDNWIGREKINVREATVATKTLLSLGRACWKQVRLGRGKPDVQQKAICGNTIFFAQPTADIPSMELPPPTDALIDSFNLILTRNLDDLRYAQWATVNRAEYMILAGQRKKECATFAHASLREDLAKTRLPEEGIPEHILCCTQQVEGADKAPVRMSGPASRAPELGKDDEAGEESDRSDGVDDDDEDVGAAQPDVESVHDNVAESTIALDPLHDVAPVRMMQALQGTIEAVSAHAAQIAKNEKSVQIADNDGVLQPVVDEGGRHCIKSLVLDVQQVVRSFDEKSRAALETAQAGADLRRTVCPQALAIPTQQPMDSFDARTWPASYVEWWYGDGAPNLDRERVMLIEEVARRVINIEELEYALSTDDIHMPYEASCQSRFNTPEIIAVLADVVRRLRLLKGTRAAIGRKGFSADLKVLAAATADDFMEAMNIARPTESITTAVTRSDMPAKVKTALRTLLLSTSDVPGTEGRKTALRFDGHGNNILFGASTFFNTPNFADTYSPLILQLHEGPGKHSHLRIRSVAQPAASEIPPEITRAEPKMPSLERMHQIGAKDPRAQAKFFILMTELHYRFVIGLDRLHIGRLTLAQPRVQVHDEVAASLQPCVAPGTIDVQSPFEAQGRGFEHGHGKGHGIVGSTMRWLRKAVVAGLATAAQKLLQTMLSFTAVQ